MNEVKDINIDINCSQNSCENRVFKNVYLEKISVIKTHEKG